jgi:hypothetical protein
MALTPVVILIVDQNCIFAFKSEGEPPIAVDPHRPMAFQIALQRMQSPSRHLQVGGRFCPIQRIKLLGKLFGMSWLDARFAPGQKEFLYTGVPKALDYALSVADHAHPVKHLRCGHLLAIRSLEVCGFPGPKSGNWCTQSFWDGWRLATRQHTVIFYVYLEDHNILEQ